MSEPTTSMLRQRIAQRLTARGETLACVEIESGGHVSRSLTAEPGSSAFFAGALILPQDSACWPQPITGDGSWRDAPPGSDARLAELAGIAQAAFGADWGLAVECQPAAFQESIHISLRTPDGSSVMESASLAESALRPGAERLVQCVLEILAQRLAEHTEAPP